MKKIIRAVFGTLMLLPAALSAQTVFTDVQVTGELQVGGVPITSNIAGDSLFIGYASFDSSVVSSYAFGAGNTFYNSNGSLCFGNFNNLNNTNGVLSYGNSNFIFSTYSENSFLIENTITLGVNNTLENVTYSSCFGTYNGIQCAGLAGNIFAFGANMTLSPSDEFNGLFVFGIGSAPIVLDPNDGLNAPYFVITSGMNTPFNPFIMQKNGKTIMSNVDYVNPTIENPNPNQPEVLILNGSAVINGQVKISQRQGDIWMGSFGRAEDQGPSN